MDEIAAVYGLTKPAMHNHHKMVEGFPAWVERKGNAHYYPAFKVFAALLAYLERKEKTEAGQAAAFADLVRPPSRNGTDAIEPLTASEQLKAFDLRSRLTQEALDQGVLHRADHCAAVSDRVFNLISTTFGTGLSDTLDPNGTWPPEVRAELDKAGENLTLRAFEQMKDMLTVGVVGPTPDADGKSTRPEQPARAGDRARPRRA